MKIVKQFEVKLSPAQAGSVKKNLKGLKPGFVVYAQTQVLDGNLKNPHIRFEVLDNEFGGVANAVLYALKRELKADLDT